jgi:hypothetical protein
MSIVEWAKGAIMFHRLWTLIRKELQSLLREPQTRAILIKIARVCGSRSSDCSSLRINVHKR